MGACIEAATGFRDRDGYAFLKGMRAHRYAWTQAHGPIPDGMTVDHMCHNRSCVNVSHLRLLTPEENGSLRRSILRTHCPNGHEFTPDNVYHRPGSRRARICRACNAAAVARYRLRRKNA